MMVGKVVKSVGFGIYKLKRSIKTPTESDMVKKKSNMPLGSGTIIISNIANTKATTPKSVISLRNLSLFFILFTRFHPYNVL
jgi:hypothetical protein